MFDNNDTSSQPGAQFQPVPAPPSAVPSLSDVPQLPNNSPHPAPPTIIPDHATPAGVVPAPPATPGSGGDDALMAIKQDALASLTPLVGQIDQSPEEKFKTTMMLIQASDNAALIKEAYAAANQIPDEKARAQALIDVINEINYFTQRQNPK